MQLVARAGFCYFLHAKELDVDQIKKTGMHRGKSQTGRGGAVDRD